MIHDWQSMNSSGTPHAETHYSSQITDAHGSLQYIPFPTCNETNLPLTFRYATPEKLTCTFASLSDDLYHLLEYYVHADVPLTCRVPTYPLVSEIQTSSQDTVIPVDDKSGSNEEWTPLTIALQGTLQLSHLHLHTDINAILHHTSTFSASPSRSQVQASAAYSVPNITTVQTAQGTKVIRGEPLAFTFSVGWLSGTAVPGGLAEPSSVLLHKSGVGLGVLVVCVLSLGAAAGLGGLAALHYDRARRRGDSLFTRPGMGRSHSNLPTHNGYGGYGGYGVGTGKRD